MNDPIYVKTPNGKILPMSQDGFITTHASMELSELISLLDLEGFLDRLGEIAVGDSVLTEVSYSIVDHHGNTLVLEYTAKVDDTSPEDYPRLRHEDLPLQTFGGTVTRTGFASRTVTVQARTQAEAEALLADDAGNHAYNEHGSEYAVQVLPVVITG